MADSNGLVEAIAREEHGGEPSEEPPNPNDFPQVMTDFPEVRLQSCSNPTMLSASVVTMHGDNKPTPPTGLRSSRRQQLLSDTVQLPERPVRRGVACHAVCSCEDGLAVPGHALCAR